jgi:endonuclease YncB( thermonuclease family)
MTSEACADFTGPVISVLNSDIVVVLSHKKAEHIRLQGIDCPKKAQTFWPRAKQATSSLSFSKTITGEAYC